MWTLVFIAVLGGADPIQIVAPTQNKEQCLALSRTVTAGVETVLGDRVIVNQCYESRRNFK